MIDDLVNKLNKMHEQSNDGESTTMIRLFGIIYCDIIKLNNIKAIEIAKRSKINDSYYAEISKGMKLAKYVDVKKEYKHLL